MTDYLHHTPGRLRVRSSVFRRDTAARRQALRELSQADGVASVRLNAKAGSVTVFYDQDVTTMERIVDLFKAYESRQQKAATPQPQVRVPRPAPAGGVAAAGLLMPMIGKAALSLLVNKGVSVSLSSLLRTRF